MTSILCLAHYCDLHGPTPLMVTEGLPVPCAACYDGEMGNDRPRSSAPSSGDATTVISEALRRVNFASAPRSSSVPASESEAQSHRAAFRRSAQLAVNSGSAIETPPQSPRLPQGPGAQQKRDSGFRKTYDEYVTRRAGPCENCALTLPKRQEGAKEKEAGADSRTDHGPTLRTRAPCARVFGGIESASPPTSQSSSSSPSDDESTKRPRPSHRRTGTTVSVTSRSSSNSSTGTNAHTHYLDYTSTHEPLQPSSFSIVRASCLRTLSLETLPRPPPSNPPAVANSFSTPTASPQTPAFVTTHSVGSAASGGPIFFGDPSTGYTTAYIFRIPDVHARGHKRVYAFLALSTHRERLAMKTFGFVAAAFRDMATWIQALAEAEAERTLAESSTSTASSPIIPGPGYGSFHSEPATILPPSAGSGSSFLMGGGGFSRRMGPGFGGSGLSLKQRGLAELVGLPDFFIELHTRFVRLLLELGVVLGS